MVTSLRNSFPSVVSSDTVKKLGIASNNESYIINALQFVGIIDADGKKTEAATPAFSSHKIEDFVKKFEPLVKEAYSELFELHGESTWELDKSGLITFFRQTDDTSDTIGKRQAGVFQVFAALSGHGEVPTPNATSIQPKTKSLASSSQVIPAKKKNAANKNTGKYGEFSDNRRDIAMSVRLEINIPSDGSKETYDNIFRSIRENLIQK